jgi:hypothetical protein
MRPLDGPPARSDVFLSGEAGLTPAESEVIDAAGARPLDG